MGRWYQHECWLHDEKPMFHVCDFEWTFFGWPMGMEHAYVEHACLCLPSARTTRSGVRASLCWHARVSVCVCCVCSPFTLQRGKTTGGNVCAQRATYVRSLLAWVKPPPPPASSLSIVYPTVRGNGRVFDINPVICPWFWINTQRTAYAAGKAHLAAACVCVSIPVKHPIADSVIIYDSLRSLCYRITANGRTHVNEN